MYVVEPFGVVDRSVRRAQARVRETSPSDVDGNHCQEYVLLGGHSQDWGWKVRVVKREQT